MLLQETIRQLQTELTRLSLRGETSAADTSDAALGDRHLSVLSARGAVTSFAGSTGEAVLSEAAAQELKTCRRERDIVRLVTPALWRLADCGDDPLDAALFNSEEVRWLDGKSRALPDRLKLKPDLFRSWTAFVKRCETVDGQGSGPCYRFGGLAGRQLQMLGCVREIYEGKLDDLTAADFGELVKYMREIPGACGGMLFCAAHFWL